MPFQHPEEVGYGYVIERYAARKDSGHARYLVLKSGRFLRPDWPHGKRFAHHLIDDAATITDAELAALLDYEWRSRLTAAWLIGRPPRTVPRTHRRPAPGQRGLLLRQRLLLRPGRFGTHADVEILTAYLDYYLPRTDLRYDQPAALGTLLRLDAHLGTHHADRFTQPDGLWDQWVNALAHLHGHPAYTPVERRRSTDLQCEFANSWSRT